MLMSSQMIIQNNKIRKINRQKEVQILSLGSFMLLALIRYIKFYGQINPVEQS